MGRLILAPGSAQSKDQALSLDRANMHSSLLRTDGQEALLSPDGLWGCPWLDPIPFRPVSVDAGLWWGEVKASSWS